MNIKVLCITVLVLTILVFSGNQYAARNESLKECQGCDCRISLSETVSARKDVNEPSCSIHFKLVAYQPETGKEWDSSNTRHLQLPDQTEEEYTLEIKVCDFVILCDKDREASVRCGSGANIMLTATQSSKCSARCVNKSKGWLDMPCESWARKTPEAVKKPTPKKPPAAKPPAKKPPARKPGGRGLLSMFFGPSRRASSISPSLMLANYTEESADDQAPDDLESKEIITGQTVWRFISGEVGIDNGMLMVAEGEAEARSFCTGDNLRLVGSNVISLPTCELDLSGSWEGAIARPISNGTKQASSITLNLRKESGSLRGDLKTVGGASYTIQGSQSGANIYLEASNTAGGPPSKLILTGKVTKGEIVFGGSEQSPGAKSIAGLIGFVRRLYIVDSALPAAILNQPYSFSLTALSPDGGAASFRLATPTTATTTTTTKATTSTRREINWFTQANSLGGRTGDRLTVACPANGSPSGFLAGTDVYKDDSSICKAAAHAGLITRQAGGVVTIQLKPDAGSYLASSRNGVASDRSGAWKGSFVFVTGESQGDEREPEAKREPKSEPERGRLPKGLSFDASSGTFSGTPTEPGSFDLLVVADDGAGNFFEQPLTLTVKKLVVTNRLLPDAFVGQPYVATLKAAGGQAPYRFSGSPPRGLQLDPNTGELSGKPLAAVSFSSFEVIIRDSQNNSESHQVSLSVRGTTILNSHFLADAKVGMPYRMQFQALGNTRPINWVFGRDEPSSIGLSLNSGTGELSGTPTKVGNYFIQVRAEGGNNPHTRNFALTIR